MKHLACLGWIIIGFCSAAWAGNKVLNVEQVFDPAIKTVQFYNASVEQSFPMIELNGGDKLRLSFDDIGGGIRNLFYTIEPCNPDWTSNTYLLPSDYMQGFNEVRISSYRLSFNTTQQYTHYESVFPNENLQNIISGNFILKVYEDNDPEKLVLVRRFCVLERLLGVGAFMVRAPMIEDRDAKHKVNFSIGTRTGPRIDNPYTDIVGVVLQNYRWDNAQYTRKPQFVRPETIEYSQDEANVFDAGNEFRRFDIRTLRFKSDRIDLIYADSFNYVKLFCDKGRNFDRYVTLIDMNGSYLVRVQEFTDPAYEADYSWVSFCLPWPEPFAGEDVYVQGRFCDWGYTEQNKLQYDYSSHAYRGKLYLKQGIYDYQYVVKGNNGIDITSTEGNRIETENTYQVLVYHKPSGSNYFKLAAFTAINSQTSYR